ncbi:hypothetical protein D3C71_1551060 [compost metagenome]
MRTIQRNGVGIALRSVRIAEQRIAAFVTLKVVCQSRVCRSACVSINQPNVIDVQRTIIIQALAYKRQLQSSCAVSDILVVQIDRSRIFAVHCITYSNLFQGTEIGRIGFEFCTGRRYINRSFCCC